MPSLNVMNWGNVHWARNHTSLISEREGVLLSDDRQDAPRASSESCDNEHGHRFTGRANFPFFERRTAQNSKRKETKQSSHGASKGPPKLSIDKNDSTSASRTVASATQEYTRRQKRLRHPSSPENPILLNLHNKEYDAALDQLMRLYGKEIFGLCRSFLHQKEDAEDALQYTFIRAYQSLPQFRAESGLRRWLYVIAQRQCIDLLRKQRPEESASDIPELSVPPSLPPDEAVSLRECLGKLNEELRSLILLRVHGGFSYNELAPIFKTSPRALQMKVTRTLSKLKTCIEKKTKTNTLRGD